MNILNEITAFSSFESQRSPTIASDSSMGSPITLRDILTNPTSLSYFMEFMDRRNRSLLVQFWLTVESFKNPLDSVDSGSSDDEDKVDPSHTDVAAPASTADTTLPPKKKLK